MRVIGLTGGIGSGKSTVARIFKELGAEVVDADQLAREVVAPGQPALKDVVAAFGPGVIQADGTLDRPRLASIIFRDDVARATLNAITHPRIRS
ncbi:MAG: dephospho-CoA kinase, partial [Chloroflexi bacterium]